MTKQEFEGRLKELNKTLMQSKTREQQSKADQAINDLVDIGAGVFATKSVKEFFDFKVKPDFRVGISGTWKF